MGMMMQALLAFCVGIWGCATAYAAEVYVADATVAQQKKQQQQNENVLLCGWVGVAVSPMTTAFADSLGMAEPYGGIFDQPEAGSPAAAAHIEQGDALTSVNGSPLMRASDFAKIKKASPQVSPFNVPWWPR
jgi:S1-C subfamily serine protease